MTILNEAVRLFFAVSALVLVGLLSSPLENSSSQNTESLPAMTSNKKEEVTGKTQIADRKIDKKMSRKALAKKS